jgi:hypothetical protein
LAFGQGHLLPPTSFGHLDKVKVQQAPEATLNRGDYVRLSKIGRSAGGAQPCPIAYYQSGIFAGIMSMPLDYVMDGYLLHSLRPKGIILLRRYVRNGVVRRGLFRSSVIRRVQGDLIETQNSIWRVAMVPPLEQFSPELLPEEER